MTAYRDKLYKDLKEVETRLEYSSHLTMSERFDAMKKSRLLSDSFSLHIMYTDIVNRKIVDILGYNSEDFDNW